MTEYNTDLLMQVREKILNEPERHYQAYWALATSNPAEGGDCGTAYCVAGWAAVLDGGKLRWQPGPLDNWQALYLVGGRSIASHAERALGLTPGEADRLFHGGNSRLYVLRVLDALITAGKNGERLAPDDPAWTGK